MWWWSIMIHSFWKSLGRENFAPRWDSAVAPVSCGELSTPGAVAESSPQDTRWPGAVQWGEVAGFPLEKPVAVAQARRHHPPTCSSVTNRRHLLPPWSWKSYHLDHSILPAPWSWKSVTLDHSILPPAKILLPYPVHLLTNWQLPDLCLYQFVISDENALTVWALLWTWCMWATYCDAIDDWSSHR